MKIGQEYRITFRDHISYTGTGYDEVLCTIRGKFVRDTAHSYELVIWEVLTPGLENNNEYFSILKSTVTNVRRLR